MCMWEVLIRVYTRGNMREGHVRTQETGEMRNGLFQLHALLASSSLSRIWLKSKIQFKISIKIKKRKQTLTAFLAFAPNKVLRLRNREGITVYLVFFWMLCLFDLVLVCFVFRSLKFKDWLLGWVKTSQHQNNCVWGSCHSCFQKWQQENSMGLPVGAPNTNSFLHCANLRSSWLKKGGICVSPSWPPRQELTKQETWGRPFLHGLRMDFSKVMKGCLCAEERKALLLVQAARSPWPHQCWLFQHFCSLGARGKKGWSMRRATFHYREWPGETGKMPSSLSWGQEG